MYASVELRLLRYVIAVAEELHFSRAALRERIAQPSLSKQIQELESRLGVQLFSRSHHKVALTEAGEAFVDEARQSLVHAEQAVRAASAFQCRGQKELTIGYSPRINFRLLTIIRELARTQMPNLRVGFVSSHAPQQIEAICDGRIQIGLQPPPVQHDEIITNRLISEPLTVALPSSHRLADKSHVKARELNLLPVISFPRQLHPAFHDHLQRLFKKEGFQPNVVQEVTTEFEALYMVAQGLGVALLRPTLDSVLTPGIVFRRFRESSLVQETAIVCRRTNLPEHVLPFIKLIRKTIAHTSPQTLGLLEIGNEDSRQLKLF